MEETDSLARSHQVGTKTAVAQISVSLCIAIPSSDDSRNQSICRDRFQSHLQYVCLVSWTYI